jgi:hypothetical protein
MVQPTYTTKVTRVETKPAHEHNKASEKHYLTEDQQVLIEEAHEHLTLVPAVYKDVDQQVLVQESRTELNIINAVYKSVSKKVLLTPAHAAWKRGTGPIQKIDELTGEIMCLVEVPATYTTVNKQVLVTPERVTKVSVLAMYKTIQKRITVTPETTSIEKHPAKYSTIKVRKIDAIAATDVNTHPAEFEDVFTRVKEGEAHLEWREILCETNTTPNLISRLQRSLKANDYNPRALDGVLGSETMSAVTAYQKANKLASGQLTIATLKKLGIRELNLPFKKSFKKEPFYD